jgi:iron complex outermembrane receptor protein
MIKKHYSLLHPWLLLISLVCTPVSSVDAQSENPENHEHEETSILITANPQQPSILEYSKPASVMTREQLITRGETTLGEALQLQPGMSSTYFGPGASRPVIRGFAGERIRVLRNGIGTLDVSNSSEDHQVTVNPLNADTIEVLRGPETLLYGSSAIGGVVNMTDTTIAERSIGEDLVGSVLLRGESVDNELTGALRLDGSVGGFNWHFSGLNQNTDDVSIPGFAESRRQREQESLMHGEGEDHHDHEHGSDGHESEEEYARGTLPNSSTNNGTYTAGGSYVWQQGFFGASFTQYNSRYGIPGHQHGEVHDDHDHESHDDAEMGERISRDDVHESDEHLHDERESLPVVDLDQWRIDTRGALYNVTENIDQLRFRFGGSRYDHKELEGATAGTLFSNDAVEARMEAVHSFAGGFRGVLGSQLESSHFDAVGDEAFVPGFNKIAPGVFLYEQYAISSELDYLVGARYEFNRVDPRRGDARSFEPLSASTGVSWKLDSEQQYVAGLNVAFTERAPSPFELYADGIHAARQIYESGDSQLGKERAVGVDLTLKRNTGIITGSVNGFIQQYSDYINLAPTSRDVDGFQVFQYDDVRARISGFETEATFHAHDLYDLGAHHIDLTSQFDYVHARDLTNNDYLPRIPPFRAIVRAAYDYKEVFFAMLEGVAAVAQSNTAPGELASDAYQLLNASFSIRSPLPKKRVINYFIRGLNLTNEEARLHASFIKDLAPLPGRSVLAGVEIQF